MRTFGLDSSTCSSFFILFSFNRVCRVTNDRKISYIPVISGYPKVPRGNYSATFFLAFLVSRMPRDCRRCRGPNFFMKIQLPSLIGIGKRSRRAQSPSRRYRSPVSQFINRVENGVMPRIKVRFSRIFKRWQMTVPCNFAQQLGRVAILIYFRRMEQIARIISCVTSVLVVTHDAVKLHDTPHFRQNFMQSSARVFGIWLSTLK